MREHRAARRILEWGLDPARYLLFLGRFSPEKNCHLLIEAYEAIETDVKLVLAGGGNPSDAYYRGLLQHASNRVRLLEYVSGDTFEELLTNAMLFVLPSDLEGLSLALLEAMGAGLCVLASDIPENRELVDGAGFLFRPGDRTDLQRMLRLLMSDREIRETAGKAAKQRIREQYLWPKIAQQVEQAYLEMMGWPALLPVASPASARAPVHVPQDGRRAGATVIPIMARASTRRAS